MITEKDKYDEVVRVYAIMHQSYPARVRDWRMKQPLADRRLAVWQEIIKDYQKKLGDGTESDG